jgi:hypothetical protein
MHRFLVNQRTLAALMALVSFMPAAPAPAMDESGMTMKKWGGRIQYVEQEFSNFELEGVASHIGDFVARGEVMLRPGKQKGTMIGEGVVVFMDDRGDLLVGETTWNVDEDDNLEMHFAWCDAVKFRDGTMVLSTGAYAENLPPDLTANGIIAILIGLLAPTPH